MAQNCLINKDFRITMKYLNFLMSDIEIIE